MPNFKVMIETEEDSVRHSQDQTYTSKGEVLCVFEARNEMLAQKYHRDGVFEKKYPRGSWVEPE